MNANLQPGDVLKRVDGMPLDTREKLMILISSKPPGSLVAIDYLREENEISVQITLGERLVEE